MRHDPEASAWFFWFGVLGAGLCLLGVAGWRLLMRAGLFGLVLCVVGCSGALRGGTVSFPASDAPWSVACVVTDADSGQPVPGATCFSDGLRGTANADGYVLIGRLPAGSRNMVATADGYQGGSTPFTNDHQQDVRVALTADVPPVLDRREFARTYQGNFGTIKVPGCGLHLDHLFDPFLLPLWRDNKPCFEQALEAHAVRNDNRIVVSPRADYNGQMPLVDLWHDPSTFLAFLRDIRRHRNRRGESFRTLVFLGADGHQPRLIQSFGVPDLDAEAHWLADIQRLASLTADQTDGTAICWECRHVVDYLTPGTFERAGSLIARVYPQAWHGVHLVQDSSSWSRWETEVDDPNHGNELAAWWSCTRAGWCDGLLYQMTAGDTYVHPDNYPGYNGQAGPFTRWKEIVERLGNDPRSAATSGGDRHGWPQVDVLNFEHIYDAYTSDTTDEAYAIAFCQRALELGGWGCGSASFRRP
jgi:hypothetical protein